MQRGKAIVPLDIWASALILTLPLKPCQWRGSQGRRCLPVRRTAALIQTEISQNVFEVINSAVSSAHYSSAPLTETLTQTRLQALILRSLKHKLFKNVYVVGFRKWDAPPLVLLTDVLGIETRDVRWVNLLHDREQLLEMSVFTYVCCDAAVRARGNH